MYFLMTLRNNSQLDLIPEIPQSLTLETKMIHWIILNDYLVTSWTNPFGKIWVKMGSSSPNRGEQLKILELPPPSEIQHHQTSISRETSDLRDEFFFNVEGCW